ncbi:MAG TPA: histidine kinase [Streptosporangiaceae bacterium]|nr:histidine kinase [Streptosporangiaceae bacterium]
MSVQAQDLVLPVLAAGAIAAVIRIRTSGTAPAKGRRGRLRDLAWSAALLALAANAMSVAYGALEDRDGRISDLAQTALINDHKRWALLLLIPVAAATVLAVRPQLARRIVPVGLIVLGLYGFVVARQTSFYSQRQIYGLAHAGAASMGLYLVLPQAYLFVLLGGWLAWRTAPEQANGTRSLLGGLIQSEQPWALLALPTAMMAAALVMPNVWFDSGVGIAWTAGVIAAAAQLIRRSPDRAAMLATAGLLGLGVAGLYLAATYSTGSWGSLAAGLTTSPGYFLYGLVDVSSQSMANVAGVQALALIGFGVWLAPRTVPQARKLLGRASATELTRRVERLTESRAVAVDTASADLRRLERDLHDGAQARLVALGMSLRAAERLIPANPEAALALVAEARETSVKALTELRELVRGVLPPVLADRGLADAIRALALDSPLHVQTEIDLPGRLSAPVETACYFAVAELLTNAAKHSGARDARIGISHPGRLLRIEVTDFGLGGADPARGSGLAGVEKRLASFDGVLAVSSPPGGPTMAVIEVPCALSSPQTAAC